MPFGDSLLRVALSRHRYSLAFFVLARQLELCLFTVPICPGSKLGFGPRTQHFSVPSAIFFDSAFSEFCQSTSRLERSLRFNSSARLAGALLKSFESSFNLIGITDTPHPTSLRTTPPDLLADQISPYFSGSYAKPSPATSFSV